MDVRPADPDDAGAIHRVSVASCRAAYGEALEDPEPFLDRVEDTSRVGALREKLAGGGDQLVYLVADDADVVGFVQLLTGDRTPEGVPGGTAYLKSLYVHPERWREGVGSALLDAAVARLPSDVDRVRLAVLAANDDARRFYERRGYERVGTGVFEAGGSRYETLVYARLLSERG